MTQPNLSAPDLSPEDIAAIWHKLEASAARIADPETRAQYLAKWRAQYEADYPPWLSDASIVRLPDWEHVGEISAAELRAVQRISHAWLAQQSPADDDARLRLAWELGRRWPDESGSDESRSDEAGPDDDTAAALARMIADHPALATRLRDSWQRGRDEGGEGLHAAMVLDLRCARLDRSEEGLAQRFAMRHGHNFYHTTAKGWLHWDGRRWEVLDEERGVVPAKLLLAARATVAVIGREAFALRASGLDASSVPATGEGGVDPEKFTVEVDGVKVPLCDLPDVIAEHPEGLDRIAMTASTCRLTSGQLAAWGKSQGELKRYKAMIGIAASGLTAQYTGFDTDPLTINCQNGTLRLIKTTGPDGFETEARLDPFRRGDLLTKITAVAYDPDATSPLYDGTMVWAQPKLGMRRYLHQWGGYNLTGDMGAQIFHMWWGPLAQNGKSTILDAWADCAGDYAAAGKIETFIEAAHAKGGDAATPALAVLPGVRMLRTGEPPHNAKFEESLINTVTGQDAVLVRDNFRSFYPVRMQFKLTVACNAQPTIPNATEGIKRRIKVVPFEQTMKNAVRADGSPLREENFKVKLVPEREGIFARLIEGALDWLKHGFIEPEDVTQWTEEYKDENDPLGRFLAYCTVIEPKERIQASRFHALFAAWSKATGGPDWSMPYLKKKMSAKGFSSKASNGMQWLGLRAVKQVDDFIDHQGNVIDLSRGDDGAGPAAGAAGGTAGAWGGDFDPFGDLEGGA